MKIKINNNNNNNLKPFNSHNRYNNNVKDSLLNDSN